MKMETKRIKRQKNKFELARETAIIKFRDARNKFESSTLSETQMKKIQQKMAKQEENIKLINFMIHFYTRVLHKLSEIK